MRVAVLIPCYNEEAAIAAVVRDFRAALPDAAIYVYDNNSTDRTVEVAANAGAIVRREMHQGKGRVVRQGNRIALLSLGTRLAEALKALADDGAVPMKSVAEAIKKYGINPEKPNPTTVVPSKAAGSRRKAVAFLSTTATLWPASPSAPASSGWTCSWTSPTGVPPTDSASPT